MGGGACSASVCAGAYLRGGCWGAQASVNPKAETVRIDSTILPDSAISYTVWTPLSLITFGPTKVIYCLNLAVDGPIAIQINPVDLKEDLTYWM